MEIEISKDISENVTQASKELGLSKEELIARAIKLYLLSMKKYIKLKEEMLDWEEAGIEDANNFLEESNL